MIWKFELYNSTVGTLQISEPDGWEEAKLRKERHPKFHSLVEYFEGSFIFYGDLGNANGGLDFIREVEAIGFDEAIIITISSSANGTSFVTRFVGDLALDQIEETENNRARIPIIPNGFWITFLNRLATPVNLMSAVNVDGGVATTHDAVNLRTKAQKIRYYGDYFEDFTITYPGGTGNFGLLVNFGGIYRDDLNKFSIQETNFDEGTYPEYQNIFGIFEAPWDGDYTFDARVEMSRIDPVGGKWAIFGGGTIRIQKTTDIGSYYTPTRLENIRTEVTYPTGDEVLVNEVNGTLTLKKGEQIAVWVHKNSGSEDQTIFGSTRIDWDIATVATTGPVALTGEQTIDGVLTSIDTILVKDQSDISENGLYTSSAGAWSRLSSANTAAQLRFKGAFVQTGDLNGDTYWFQVNDKLQVLGTDDVNFQATNASDEFQRPYPGYLNTGYPGPDSHLRITADTTFPDSDAQGFFAHDAAGLIVDRITGVNGSFRAPILGSSETTYQTYAEDGCLWKHMLIRGLQARGYSLSDKLFQMSFNQWWDGMDPILNLGLEYDNSDGTDKIIVRSKAEFYDDSSTSIDFYNVGTITRRYDEDRIFNKVEIGYNQWQAEDISGLDDPQTKHEYSTILKKSGKTATLYSDFIAASLAYEFTRRQAIDQSKDYKFDNNTFIVATNPEPLTGDELPEGITSFQPELSENFSSVTGLLNEETRINKRLTPARNLIRWRNYLSAALQSYLSSTFTFQSGEGNYDMSSTMSLDLCDPGANDGSSVSEKGNIGIDDNPLTVAMQGAEIEVEMNLDQYEAIDNKKAIGISQSSSGPVAKLFIKLMDYDMMAGKATITGWFKETYLMRQNTGSISSPICYARYDAPCGDDAILAEDGDYLIAEDGEECLIVE